MDVLEWQRRKSQCNLASDSETNVSLIQKRNYKGKTSIENSSPPYQIGLPTVKRWEFTWYNDYQKLRNISDEHFLSTHWWNFRTKPQCHAKQIPNRFPKNMYESVNKGEDNHKLILHSMQTLSILMLVFFTDPLPVNYQHKVKQHRVLLIHFLE